MEKKNVFQRVDVDVEDFMGKAEFELGLGGVLEIK